MKAFRSLRFPFLMAGLFGALAAVTSMSESVHAQTVAPAVAGQPVPVSLVDYRIAMPQSVPAGAMSFLVTNHGSHAHNFEIRGPSVSQRFATDLQPGETRLMQARLAPGSYTVICPVDAHTLLGMQTRLTAY